MVTIKYMGPGRYGTAKPKKIWAPDEAQDVPLEVADVLLQDPHFVKIGIEPVHGEPVSAKKAKPSKRQVTQTS